MFPYSKINLLHRVSKPLKYLGSEVNLNRKNIKSEGDLEGYSKILLIYPGLYEQMLNDPWFEALYHSLNEEQHFLIDFVFLPDEDVWEILEDNKEYLLSSVYNLSFDNFNLFYFNADQESQISGCLQLTEIGGIHITDDSNLPVLLPSLAELPVFSGMKIKKTADRNPCIIKEEIKNLFEKYNNNRNKFSSFKLFWKENADIDSGDIKVELQENQKKQFNPLISWIDTASLINRIKPEDIEIPRSYRYLDFPFSINLKSRFSGFDWKVFSLYSPFWSWIKDKNWFETFPAAKIKSWPLSVELNDVAKAEFISFIKNYHYPVIISHKDWDDIINDPSEIFSLFEELYKDNWNGINLFLQISPDDKSFSDISEFYKRLQAKFGKLKVLFYFQPDFNKLIETGKNSREVLEIFESFTEKLKKVIDEEKSVLPSRDQMYKLLTLYQDDISLVLNKEKKGKKEVKEEIVGEKEFILKSGSALSFTTNNLKSDEQDNFDEGNTENQSANKPKSKLGFNGKPIQFGRATKRIHIVKPLMKKLIRIKYIKGEESVYYSHLNVIRVFDKICKKTGIKIIYKQGKNPRPRISFAPPLNTGFLSKAEYMDFNLEISENESLMIKLNPLLPKGIRIINEKLIMEKTPSLSSSIEQNDYSITGFSKFNPQWISEFMEKNSVFIKRIKQDDEYDFNVRPFVKQMDWKNDTLTITVMAVENKMARVIEIIEALLPQEFFEPYKLTYIRTGQFVIENEIRKDPMEIVS